MKINLPSKLQKRCVLSLVFAMPLLVWMGLFFAVAWQDKPEFYRGMDRCGVYAIMGNPSNVDDHVIAFWSSDGSKGKPWRELSPADGFIAVFEKYGRVMTCKCKRSELPIENTMTDQEIARIVESRLP